jgi:hypothetical protein
MKRKEIMDRKFWIKNSVLAVNGRWWRALSRQRC